MIKSFGKALVKNKISKKVRRLLTFKNDVNIH